MGRLVFQSGTRESLCNLKSNIDHDLNLSHNQSFYFYCLPHHTHCHFSRSLLLFWAAHERGRATSDRQQATMSHLTQQVQCGENQHSHQNTTMCGE